MYSSAEPHNNNTTQQEESEDENSGSSRSEEITGTGGDTTEMEVTQQYALETIPENEDDERDNLAIQQALMEQHIEQNMQNMHLHHEMHDTGSQNHLNHQNHPNNFHLAAVHHNSHHSINQPTSNSHQLQNQNSHPNLPPGQHQLRSTSQQGSLREGRLPTRESHHSAHNLSQHELLQIDSDEGSLLDEKIYRKEMSMAQLSMVRKSSDDLSGNGLHKPKAIWRRRTARPMSFQERSTYEYEGGNYQASPTERVRGASFHGKTPVQIVMKERAF